MNTNIRALTTVEITAADLPLYCSAPDTSWNGHPRVFLALNDKLEAQCPYCSTKYKLVGEYKPHH